MGETTDKLMDAWDAYEKRFSDTFTNIDMTAEETLQAIKIALETGIPYDIGDVPDNVLL